ncbi:hypothetical protein NDU88_002866 [Pleurodeles waltl]|uniref:Uncharacterized protein n=1 Tax=Pleurodeles waltl TaxID=8319 RepID=A0AAV7UAH4_PLEWA|nr:hypothetical protein NDU88_002866 [Pleurodeles waltl]
MTYDAEGVIKRKREDGRRERSEEKEEPRTRRSRGEETTIIQEREEERENTVAGEQSTKREPTFTQELKGEEDTASKVIETEGETRKAGRLEDRKNQWATPNPTEEKSGDHLRAGRAPGGTWPSQVGRPTSLDELGSDFVVSVSVYARARQLAQRMCLLILFPTVKLAAA